MNNRMMSKPSSTQAAHSTGIGLRVGNTPNTSPIEGNPTPGVAATTVTWPSVVRFKRRSAFSRERLATVVQRLEDLYPFRQMSKMGHLTDVVTEGLKDFQVVPIKTDESRRVLSPDSARGPDIQLLLMLIDNWAGISVTRRKFEVFRLQSRVRMSLFNIWIHTGYYSCLLYTSPSPRDRG